MFGKFFCLLVAGFALAEASEIQNIAYLRVPIEPLCKEKCFSLTQCHAYLYDTDSNTCRLFDQSIGQENASETVKIGQNIRTNYVHTELCAEAGCNEENGYCVVLGETARCICKALVKNVDERCNKKKNIESELSWSDWSACSVACGTGFKTRRRLNCPPDIDCSDFPIIDIQMCENAKCTKSFHLWSDWSACASPQPCLPLEQQRVETSCDGIENCKETGVIEKRTCVDEKSIDIKMDCRDELFLNSNDRESFGEGFLARRFSESGKLALYAWQDEDRSMNDAARACQALGFRNAFTKEARFPSDPDLLMIEFERKDCPVFDISNSTTCKSVIEKNQSVRGIYVKCIVDGVFTEWTAFEKCDCASKEKIRTRTCSSPPPENGGKQCDGETEQTIACDASEISTCPTQPTSTTKRERWSAWSDCSIKCGIGKQYRVENCFSDNCESLQKEYRTCSDFSAPCEIQTSCNAWARIGAEISGEYPIKPDQLESFTITCRFDSNRTISLIEHDHETDQSIKSFEQPGSFSRELNYGAGGIRNARRLRVASNFCRQTYKFRCINSAIHDPLKTGVINTYWFNSDGEKRFYWLEDVNSKNCECGQRGNCGDSKSEIQCNCDMNDNEWREDAGQISNKADLPISKIAVGDTGGVDEEAIFDIGPLECWQ